MNIRPHRHHKGRRRRASAAIVVGLGLLAASCGDSDPIATTDQSTSSATSTSSINGSTSSAATTSTRSTEPTSTTSTPSSTVSSTTVTSTTAAPATTDLPGEPVDIGPQAGDVLGVVGVRHDDVLNVRAAPGIDQEIATTLAPTTEGVVALGHTRLLTSSGWYEISVDGTIGWANASFLAFLGAVDDATHEVVAHYGGIPTAGSLEEMADLVTAVFASTEPESRITITVAPSAGDLGEITADVVGIGDDAVAGFRLHIFAQTEGGDWGLKSVERTTLCSRGLSGELCV